MVFKMTNEMTSPAVEMYQSQAELFKTLAHPARLAILEVLRGGEECVCHLETALGYRQAYLSQQLAVLREAGIVQDRRDGWYTFYRVTRPEVFALLDAARGVAGLPSEGLAMHLVPSDCPCPKCSAGRAPAQER
jgi:ArsR family transcriptional regulator